MLISIRVSASCHKVPSWHDGYRRSYAKNQCQSSWVFKSNTRLKSSMGKPAACVKCVRDTLLCILNVNACMKRPRSLVAHAEDISLGRMRTGRTEHRYKCGMTCLFARGKQAPSADSFICECSSLACPLPKLPLLLLRACLPCACEVRASSAAQGRHSHLVGCLTQQEHASPGSSSVHPLASHVVKERLLTRPAHVQGISPAASCILHSSTKAGLKNR